MTKLYIYEFDGLGRTEQSDSVPVPSIDAATTDQVVDYTAGAAASVPFQPTTRWVLVASDAICSIKFSPSAAPVAATTANFRLPANNQPLLFRVPDSIKTVPQGQPATWQLSAITNT
jgi:hypothetical protein